jgi:23S rRNA-/tRNA-specific pseudouridylate synthase
MTVETQSESAVRVNASAADDIVARVLYRDGLMLAIDKPAGLKVHAGTGSGPTLGAGFEALRFGLKRPAVRVTAPVPAPMRAALAACGLTEM